MTIAAVDSWLSNARDALAEAAGIDPSELGQYRLRVFVGQVTPDFYAWSAQPYSLSTTFESPGGWVEPSNDSAEPANNDYTSANPASSLS